MAAINNILSFFLFALILCFTKSTDADNSMFFARDVKWSNLPPSGGSLVSGRGNFRPGFYGDSRAYMTEPLFAFKRSAQWSK